jgi:hypothetical protein
MKAAHNNFKGTIIRQTTEGHHGSLAAGPKSLQNIKANQSNIRATHQEFKVQLVVVEVWTTRRGIGTKVTSTVVTKLLKLDRCMSWTLFQRPFQAVAGRAHIGSKQPSETKFKGWINIDKKHLKERHNIVGGGNMPMVMPFLEYLTLMIALNGSQVAERYELLLQLLQIFGTMPP